MWPLLFGLPESEMCFSNMHLSEVLEEEELTLSDTCSIELSRNGSL